MPRGRTRPTLPGHREPAHEHGHGRGGLVGVNEHGHGRGGLVGVTDALVRQVALRQDHVGVRREVVSEEMRQTMVCGTMEIAVARRFKEQAARTDELTDVTQAV